MSELSLSLTLANPMLRGTNASPPAPAFSPLDVASIIALWDDEVGVTPSGSDLSTWEDRVSGQVFTGIAGPPIEATGFPGSLSCIGFNGSTETVSRSTPTFPSGGNPGELWAVVDQRRLAASTAENIIFGYGNTGATSRYLKRRVTSGVNRLAVGVGDGVAAGEVSLTTVDFSGAHVIRAIFDTTGVLGAANTYAQIDNGTKVGASPAVVAASTATNRTRAGANSASTAAAYSLVGIKLLVVSNAVITGTDETNMWAYMLSRAGLS